MLSTFGKLYDILTPRERRQAMLLLVLMLGLGVIEMIGVASIFPLIAVLSEPKLIQSNKYLAYAYDTLGFSETNSFLIFLSVAVFLVIVVRTGWTAFTNYAILRYAEMRTHVLGTRLLRSYLHRRYAWFLSRHSADMGKTVLSEVEQVVRGSLLPALQLVSRGIIAIFLFALVVVVDPIVALVATIFLGGAYGAFYLFIRRFLLRKGRERIAANRERYKVAQEVLAGVKEVKMGGHEAGYLRRFERAAIRFGRLKTIIQLVKQLPRYLLELIAIGGIVTLILTLLFRADGDLNAILPVIALYAFAGFRLLPVIQALYQATVSLRYGKPALEALHDDLTEDVLVAEPAAERLPFNSEISLHDVSFTYPGAERPVLENVSLTIPAGSSVGIFGPSGAGKSTLIDIILGLLEPTSGEVRVDGKVINRSNVRAWQRAIGYVPQHIFLSDENLTANIAFGCAPNQVNMDAVKRAAVVANLHEFITDELPHGYHTLVGDKGIRLSGGQRQRIGVARAIYRGSEVIVLDEGTASLDELTAQKVLRSIFSLKGRTIILVAHHQEVIDKCSQKIAVKNGKASNMANRIRLEKYDCTTQ